jgi:hypothetical protein
MTKRPSLADRMRAFVEPEPAPESVLKPVVQAEPSVSPVAEHVVIPRAGGKFHARTREGMKKLLTPVEPSLHKRLKILAVKQDTTLEAITRAALAEYLERYDKA